MSEPDDIADVLAQVVEIGPTPQQAELGAAVSRHLSARPALPPPAANAETVAALRAAAADPTRCPTCGRPYQGAS